MTWAKAGVQEINFRAILDVEEDAQVQSEAKKERHSCPAYSFSNRGLMRARTHILFCRFMLQTDHGQFILQIQSNS